MSLLGFANDFIDLLAPHSVAIMCGLPGAGKSTFANKLLERYVGHKHIVSADYFHTDKDGVYRYDPMKATDAHIACFRQAMQYLTAARQIFDRSLLIVDNTNTTRAERMPYVMLARALDITPFLVHVAGEPHVCAERTLHSVPLETIQRMHRNFEYPLNYEPASFTVSNNLTT